MLAPLANALWIASSLPAWARFRRATRRVQETQSQVLAAILKRNQGSDFGRSHGFSSIQSVREFQNLVPLASHEDLRPWISRIENGEPNVLTSERVLLLEPTSGSASASKLIPCTASLKSEFSRAISPWIVDLATHDWRLLCGRAYWSVSPLSSREKRTSGGIPIGFEDDAEYFGRAQSAFVRAIQAVPPEVRFVEDADAFRYVTLLFLLRAPDLALVSVWSPSFFLILLSRLRDWWLKLADDIGRGEISCALPDDLRARFGYLGRADPRRASEVRAAFQSAEAPEIHARLWPNLRLISCWADAHAAPEAAELAVQMPHARLQPKGLLATEGVVSFPLCARQGAALAVKSHFFEFLPTRFEAGEIQVSHAPILAHELEIGAQYSVVISTGGGLYRYQLNDVVEVVGFEKQCPLLRFVGRADKVSDLFGEKLHEAHVERALQVLAERHGIEPSFVMLAPEAYQSGVAYTLFIESDAPAETLQAVGRGLDELLCENFHYALCRKLGQLGAARVVRVDGGAREAYLGRCVELGQRAGDVKACALDRRGGWMLVFQGNLH